MKPKKVRGHKKLWKQIDQWEKQNLILDLDELQYRQRIYTKAAINPYCNYPLLNIAYSEPSGKTRNKILMSLLNIYESWHKQMEEFNGPYYLKIWLYEPFLTKSQVVCATGDFINFYRDIFFKPVTDKRLPVKNYGALQNRMEKLSWEYAIHEEVVSKADIGKAYEFYSLREYQENKKNISRRIQSPYRTTENVEGETFYHTKYGAVWIGGNP